MVNGLLYRKCLTFDRPDKVEKSTLVAPRDCRNIILSLAHESPLAGHFYHRKTEMKVADQFYCLVWEPTSEPSVVLVTNANTSR